MRRTAKETVCSFAVAFSLISLCLASPPQARGQSTAQSPIFRGEWKGKMSHGTDSYSPTWQLTLTFDQAGSGITGKTKIEAGRNFAVFALQGSVEGNTIIANEGDILEEDSSELQGHWCRNRTMRLTLIVGDKLEGTWSSPTSGCTGGNIVARRGNCSSSTEASVVSDLLKDPKDPIAANRDWITIIQVLEDFYDTQKQRMNQERAETVARAVIAHQFLNLAELSRDGRASDGYWSGELARESLLALASQVKDNKSDWLEVAGKKDIVEWIYCFALDDLLGISASEEHCAQVEVGSTHLERHLKPFLREYIRQKLSLGIEGCEKERAQRLVAIYRAVREEHVSFVQNAVVPGFNDVTEMGGGGQWLAKTFLPGKALAARREAARLAVWDLKESGKLSAEEAKILVLAIMSLES